jgi:hypothetical protein
MNYSPKLPRAGRVDWNTEASTLPLSISRTPREPREGAWIETGSLCINTHSLPDKPLELGRHLEDTAARAEEFAAPFALGWGRLAGLLHDAGKYQLAFQKRIGVDPDAHTNEWNRPSDCSRTG